jgi:hypothetical protein
MKITDLKWTTNNDGETWTLTGYVNPTSDSRTITTRRLFELQYLGRTRVALGGGYERWQVYDRRYWVDDPHDPPEFSDLDEVKAWVEAVVRIDQ